MKKIINGKVYDTETAKELGEWANTYNTSDFGYVIETLYKKKTGEFFLYGKGGAKTQYAEPDGSNWWRAGDRIMPLSFAEARKWAEEHFTADEYEAIFGAVAEDESRMQVCYSLSTATVETIKRRAAERGISASAYIDFLINGSEN